MGSPRPIEGKCGAKLRDGTFCRRPPREGYSRCSHHGPGTKDSPGGRPIIHGKYSARFKREVAAVQDRIDQALRDPDLLEARRPVAIQAVLMEEIGLVPDDEVVYEMAYQMIPASARAAAIREGEEIEPTAAQLELARRKFLQQSMAAATSYQRAVTEGAKQVQLGKMIASELMPMFEDYATQVKRLIDRYVPEENREDFLEGFRRLSRQVVVRAATIGD